jgi:hypothetical protein
MRAGRVQLLGLSLLGYLFTSCGDDCPGIASCALQLAIRVSVSAAPEGGPVANVSIQVSGPVAAQNACTVQANATLCDVPGYPGHYTLVVGAPGFQNAQREVSVSGSAGQCDCPIVTMQSISVTLARL